MKMYFRHAEGIIELADNGDTVELCAPLPILEREAMEAAIDERLGRRELVTLSDIRRHRERLQRQHQ